MATTNLYLDKRYNREDGTYPLKLKVTLDGCHGFLINLQTSLLAEQWDLRRGRVIHHRYAPDLNRFLLDKQLDVEMQLRTLDRNGELYRLTASEIKSKVCRMLAVGIDTKHHSFVEYSGPFRGRFLKKKYIFRKKRHEIF